MSEGGQGTEVEGRRPELRRRRVEDEVDAGISESPRSRAQRLWSKVKYQLVEFNALPDYLRDNEFILRHYRADWPLKHALLSIFQIHNETLNIWTHLVGFLLFLGLTIYTVVGLPSMAQLHSGIMTTLPSYLHLPEMFSNCLPGATNRSELCVLQTMKDEVANLMTPYLMRPITRWPFFIFLGGAMFCLFSSSTCHLLSCHSERWAYLLLRLDYTGITLLIAASFYPPVYYSFMCNPVLRNMYLGIITSIGVVTIMVSLLPVFQTAKFRVFRASLFFGMGVSGVVPCVHKLFLHQDEPVALTTLFLEIAMGLFYGLGALVYATRIPERWKPGKFDIAGNSHQLFHVLVVAGAYTHYQAGLLYLKWRDVKGCDT